MLTTAMVKANKFQVAERTQLGTVMAEQNLGSSGAVNAATAARIGKLTGAGYMLIGIVTEADSSRRDTRSFGVSVSKTTVTLAVDIRFVDSSTGVTLWAETFREVRTGTNVAGSGSFNVSSGIGGEMARAAINGIARKVHQTVYPPKVVKADGDAIILNYGEAMFAVGETWDVFIQGEALIDPDTGENLGADETKLGTIRITEVQAKIAKATLTEGAAEWGAVCRKRAAAPASTSPPREKPNPFK